MPRKVFESGTLKRDYHPGNILDTQAATTEEVQDLKLVALTEAAADKIYQRNYRQLFFDGWLRTDVPASLALTTLNRFALSQLQSLLLPRDGYVLSIVPTIKETYVSGSVTAEVYVSGVASGLSATIDSENPNFNEGIAAWGEVPFSAGEEIQIKITSDASWGEPTADIRVMIEVALDG